ncbi:AAA family ATPase [Vibrio sp. PID23_8]|uniref:AAA family ATPase n=1 Tax=Vibrio sp. PID23_8 TaxID=1583767 RepID=UPI000E684368|nr:AAA family ATPase [Vibrio sp. PID23_8]RIZ56752.1 hypothetical protein AK966_01050 [Vibrio sp. PID23_8]
MIEIIGESGTSEYEAAIAIANALKEQFTGIDKTPASEELVKIIASAKLSGYCVSDIDVVVCAHFRDKRYFKPTRLLKDKNGKRIDKPVKVENLVLAVEVKDHDESKVAFNGDNILVSYTRGAKQGQKSATDQNIKQLHALSGYFKDHGHETFVHRCLFMRGLHRIRIPGAIGCSFDGKDFLSAVAAATQLMHIGQNYVLRSVTNETTLKQIQNSPLFNLVVPSALDRRRMDLITTTTKESSSLFSELGNKMVCLRGHGGTGKTIMFLQAAWKAFNEEGKRSVVLTYNHALAADIRRLLTLLRIPTDPDQGGVVVSTVMSFIYRWLTKFEVIDQTEDDFLDNYGIHCSTALDMLTGKAITEEDIDAVRNSDDDTFDFDLIFIDEAQDWPQAEVELVKQLYGSTNFCIADGIDQMIRGERPEWSRGVPKEARKLLPLKKCLRMKRNLSVFINAIANANRLPWQVEPNNLAGGGKVKLLLTPYANNMALHQNLLDSAKHSGNDEIDFLFCVPPSMVKEVGGRKVSRISEVFSEQGFQVWDGVDGTLRKDFPRQKRQFRVVQYASTRGLEGWTVILDGLDEYWEYCFQRRKGQGLTSGQELAFEEIDEVAELYAWQQVVIPLTRPIDTLVVTLYNEQSYFSKKLLEISHGLSEFVDTINGKPRQHCCPSRVFE